jgi:hypothetical protein
LIRFLQQTESLTASRFASPTGARKPKLPEGKAVFLKQSDRFWQDRLSCNRYPKAQSNSRIAVAESD